MTVVNDTGYLYPLGGAGNPSAMAAPGRPFLQRGSFTNATGSVEEVLVRFPSLCTNVTIINESTNATGTIMRAHFDTRTGNTKVVNSSAGSIGCNVPMAIGESVSMDVVCRDLYVSRDSQTVANTTYYTVIAQLSGVAPLDYSISGSGINL